jgi:hypothetical protein
VAWLEPNLIWSVQIDVPKAVHRVLGRFNVPRGWFEACLVGMKPFTKTPLLSIYKRRLPPHLNNTQEQEEYQRARARATPLHRLRP